MGTQRRQQGFGKRNFFKSLQRVSGGRGKFMNGGNIEYRRWRPLFLRSGKSNFLDLVKNLDSNTPS